MEDNKYVAFRLGKERFALPIENVERILPAQKVTPIPKAPKLLLGLFELRGATVPVIDTHGRFDMPTQEEPKNFVIVRGESSRYAIRVDEALGIETFEAEDVDQAPSLLDGTDDCVVTGVAKQGSTLTVLLNPDHLTTKEVERAAA